LAKIETWQTTSTYRNIHASIRVGISVSLTRQTRWEGEKEIKNIEGFLMQLFKWWEDINIILFLLSRFLM
jgi:hypothetical protein